MPKNHLSGIRRKIELSMRKSPEHMKRMRKVIKIHQELERNIYLRNKTNNNLEHRNPTLEPAQSPNNEPKMSPIRKLTQTEVEALWITRKIFSKNKHQPYLQLPIVNSETNFPNLVVYNFKRHKNPVTKVQ